MIIKVNASAGYDVIADKNVISSCGLFFRKIFSPCKIALITDSNVDKLYSRTVTCSLESENYAVYKYVFEAGEQSKNIAVFADIQNFLAENAFTRADVIVALGGGVTGDLAGFCAATYMRGIRYVQIPTTLLAAIDSSVGGKTAVDTEYGKNLIGAFYQPSLVIADTEVCSELPQEIYSDGMGEFAKYVLLIGGEFAEKVIDGDFSVSERIAECIAYKSEIVMRDEFEKNERKLLNLGHTVAHAIEKIENYAILHGKAVAIGLNFIARQCMKSGICSPECYDEIVTVLKNCSVYYEFNYDVKAISAAMTVDKKKMSDGGISLVLIRAVGDVFVQNMTESEAEEFLCR